MRAWDQYPRETPHLQLVHSPSHMCCGMCAHSVSMAQIHILLKENWKQDRQKSTKTKTSSKIASSVVAQPLTKTEFLQNMARRAIGSKAFTAHFLPSHQVSTAELPWGERGTIVFHSNTYLWRTFLWIKQLTLLQIGKEIKTKKERQKAKKFITRMMDTGSVKSVP